MVLFDNEVHVLYNFSSFSLTISVCIHVLEPVYDFGILYVNFPLCRVFSLGSCLIAHISQVPVYLILRPHN